MPVSGQYTFTETPLSLNVAIPLKGVSPKKVDIFCGESLLKVNFAPYLIDVLLHKRIDPKRHTATVKEGMLNVILYKADKGIWGQMESDVSLSKDKKAIKELRAEAFKKQEQFELERKEKRKQDLIEDDKFATRSQMALDEMERNRIDEAKEEMKRVAEEEVYNAFAKMKADELAEEKAKQKAIDNKKEKEKQSNAVAPSPATNDTATNSNHSNGGSSSRVPNATVFQVDKDKPISRTEFSKHNMDNMDDDIDIADDDIENDDGNADENNDDDEDYILVNGDENDDEIKYIPPPRQALPKDDGNIAKSNKVDISFTPRIFSTPMRDSKAAEEEEWILKNRRHLKKHAVYKNNIPKVGTMEEEDPTWMKAKGDDFFRGGDFRSAVNAYSEALDMDEHMIGCYANRAACYLKLNLSVDCQADCSTGISEILGYTNENKIHDIEETSQITLIKLYLRRSVAETQMGKFAEGLKDCRSARDCVEEIWLSGDKETPKAISIDQIEADISRLEKLVFADSLKKEADSLFAESNVDEAILRYTDALEVVPCHVSCLSNRSACHMTLGDMEKAVEDCTRALSVLELNVSKQQKVGVDAPSMASAVVPPAGSEKRKDWTLKTLARRGAAHIHLGKIEEAITDYGFAVSIDPGNEKLKRDLTKLKNTHEFQKEGGIFKDHEIKQ